MYVNRIQLAGNLGADAEIRYLPSGDAVANWNMAVSRRWKKDGEQQEETTWFRCKLYGKSVTNLSAYLTKGKAVYVDGRVEVKTFTNKEGVEQKAIEVVVQDVQLVGSKNEGEESPKPASRPTPKAAAPKPESTTMFDDDDTPF